VNQAEHDAWGHPDSREWPEKCPTCMSMSREHDTFCSSCGAVEAVAYWPDTEEGRHNHAPYWWTCPDPWHKAHIHDECIRCGACSECDEPCEHPIAGPVERTRG
jgi:hypothetical protein